MKHSHKEYEKAFLLEPTKLTRLLNTIHDCLTDQRDAITRASFEVFLSGNRREEMTSLEDVLALDNSRRRRIERLVIVSSFSSVSAARPEHEVQVDFGCPKPGAAGNAPKIVGVSVRGKSAGWVARTLSEVEEQVERTWITRTPILLVALGIAVVMLAVLFSQISLESADLRSSTMWLRETDFDRIEAMLAAGDTLSVDELRAIATIQVRNVVSRYRPAPATPIDVKSTIFWAAPVAAIIVAMLILLTCYPNVVFLWGDEVQRYTALVQRRKRRSGAL